MIENKSAICEYRGHVAPIKGIVSLYSNKDNYYFATACKDRSVKVIEYNKQTNFFKPIAIAPEDHWLSVECISAPSQSRVFATGSTDKTIHIFRVWIF